MIEVTREQAIEMLIDRDYNAFNEGQLSLNDIFLYGWRGYSYRGNKELEENYNTGLEREEEIKIV